MSADRIDAVAEGERVLADYYGGGSPTYEQSAIMKACIRDLLAALASQKEDKRYSRFLAERSARLTAEAELARVRTDYDALRKAVYPKDDGTWAGVQVCHLAEAHRSDSETMDDLDADGSIEGGVRKLKADYDALQKQQESDLCERWNRTGKNCSEFTNVIQVAETQANAKIALQAAKDAADAQIAALRTRVAGMLRIWATRLETTPPARFTVSEMRDEADLLAPPQKKDK